MFVCFAFYSTLSGLRWQFYFLLYRHQKDFLQLSHFDFEVFDCFAFM
jgi:hypothetical protein